MWKGASYDVLRKNCNSFCIVLAGELGADPPPPWTHRLGDGAAALEDRARRLAASLEQGPEIDGSAGPAAVVWDDHGDWHAAHFDTLDEAEPTWASLPLTHAACVFVRVNSPRVADAGGGAVVRVPDEGDSPAAAWRVAKTYSRPRRNLPPRNSHVTAAASPRPVSAEDPRDLAHNLAGTDCRTRRSASRSALARRARSGAAARPRRIPRRSF